MVLVIVATNIPNWHVYESSLRCCIRSNVETTRFSYDKAKLYYTSLMLNSVSPTTLLYRNRHCRQYEEYMNSPIYAYSWLLYTSV